MQLNDMEQYWVWLSTIKGIGTRRFYQLISVFEDARAVWDNVNSPEMRQLLPPDVLKRLKSARSEQYFFEVFHCLNRIGARAIPRISDDYPSLLNQIYDPPTTLYMLGDCDISGDRCFSIVGSRRCGRDGIRAARDFAEELAIHDVTVVSGMAVGIDTAAHEGALLGRGRTIAVLAGGVDVIYPRENNLLYHQILSNGGAILSEHLPGFQPLRTNFPARNRIISGLSKGVLMVEGEEKSGAMITVNCALEQNRDVFAVPGSIYASRCIAPNKLIVEGAIPATTPWHILEHYGWAYRPQNEPATFRSTIKLEPDDDKIVQPLLEQELSFEELLELVDFPISKLNSHLTMLELRGIIVKVPGGLYRAYLSPNH